MKPGFGAEVSRLMAERGIASHRSLSRASGVSQAQVSRLLKDERLGITTETYFALCRALGVTCAHFEPWLDLPAPPADPASVASASAEAVVPKPRKSSLKSPELGAGTGEALAPRPADFSAPTKPKRRRKPPA